jgi:hypothetical protein
MIVPPVVVVEPDVAVVVTALVVLRQSGRDR